MITLRQAVEGTWAGKELYRVPGGHVRLEGMPARYFNVAAVAAMAGLSLWEVVADARLAQEVVHAVDSRAFPLVVSSSPTC